MAPHREGRAAAGVAAARVAAAKAAARAVVVWAAAMEAVVTVVEMAVAGMAAAWAGVAMEAGTAAAGSVVAGRVVATAAVGRVVERAAATVPRVATAATEVASCRIATRRSPGSQSSSCSHRSSCRSSIDLGLLHASRRRYCRRSIANRLPQADSRPRQR